MHKQLSTIFTHPSPLPKARISNLENERLTLDFDDIEQKTEPNGPHRFTVSSLACNLSKNRYLDVKPSDHSRVKLSSLPNDPGSDYINASYIGERTYISCQAPLFNTVGDFWRMIWETNSSLIVMLTRLSERGCVKAHIYWPAENESFQLHGLDLDVQLNKTINLGGIIVRTLILSKRSTSGLLKRSIVQLHYTQWPDHGAPVSTEEICRMLEIHDQVSKETRSAGPTVVHCSAGIGRSGTFIAADMLMKKMRLLMSELQKKREEGHREEHVNNHNTEEHSWATPLKMLKKIVEELREQRRGMVQTEDQYKFIYQIFKDKLSTQWMRVCHNRQEIDDGLRRSTDGLKKDAYSSNELSSPATSSWAMSPCQSPTYAAINVHS
eukprot:TRINITY_DN3543_c0_g1_i1.p1 TRINITY_DN3543_c0_g1~~TRINITY_DN3543_c0_g1_i1.p1  ORF type:complete len:381 (+),score=47.79 TRINITY_DN3543_c0_g1_i1:54-1196(+)